MLARDFTNLIAVNGSVIRIRKMQDPRRTTVESSEKTEKEKKSAIRCELHTSGYWASQILMPTRA